MKEDMRAWSADPSPNTGNAGYTLLEALVALAVFMAILGGVLTLFDVNNKIARAQVNVAEMQQSLRAVQSGMVRDVRMAGRGGLPASRPAAPLAGYLGMLLPLGPSIAVDDNVAPGTELGGHPEAPVVEGTDVITVRGVLSTPMYQITPGSDGAIQGAKAAGGGSLVIPSKSPTGVPQDLTPWKEIVESSEPEAILLISAGADQVQAVVEASGGTWSSDSVTLNFRIAGGTHSIEYSKLSPQGEFPTGLRTVSGVGILEEYRYYIRDTAPAPRLSRGRFYPGTFTPYKNDVDNVHTDIGDNILDLQVALGIDRDGDGILTDTADAADEWLYNSPDDMASFDPNDWNGPTRSLQYLRITTLARTDRVDPKYVSPAITAIEDRDYSEPTVPGAADTIERGYRRRQLQTVVDLRNLT